MTNNKSVANTYKLPLIIMLVAVTGFVLKYVSTQYTSSSNTTSQPNFNLNNKFLGSKIPDDWKNYNNTKYRFVIYTPPLLLPRHVESNGQYLEFIKFEENRYSKHKGLALGITDRNLEKEVMFIKDQLKAFTNNLPKTQNLKVDGKEGLRMDYDGQGNLESKSVVVVNSEGVTLSISTTPEQIETVIASIDFY